MSGAPYDQGVVAPPAWTGGGFAPYEVGDPGRAARAVVPQPPLDPRDPVDTAIDAATLGPLVVRAGSVRGTSHRHAGTPRQDDYAVCTTDDGAWLIAAVADGVSAGELSHQAATIACRAAAMHVRDTVQAGDPDAIEWSEMLSAAATRIVAHGQRTLGADSTEDVSPADVARSMATTLVVAALPATPDAEGAHRGAMLAIGDTSVFLLDSEGGWQPRTKVKNEGAEVASSATVALPYLPTEPIEAAPVSVEPGQALFVMTDGVGDALGNGEGDVGRFLSEMWASPPDPVSFAGQVGFARRSYDDDRTVVGIWVEA